MSLRVSLRSAVAVATDMADQTSKDVPASGQPLVPMCASNSEREAAHEAQPVPTRGGVGEQRRSCPSMYLVTSSITSRSQRAGALLDPLQQLVDPAVPSRHRALAARLVTEARDHQRRAQAADGVVRP